MLGRQQLRLSRMPMCPYWKGKLTEYMGKGLSVCLAPAAVGDDRWYKEEET